MKRSIKVFVNLLSLLLVALACLGFSACKEDIKQIELKIAVYNYTSNKEEEHTLKVDLYRHLAPSTVDAIVQYVDGGYYNDAIFYKIDEAGRSSQIMLGDLKMDAQGQIYQNAIKPEIKGEFKAGGTVGSNLLNTKGSIGLWRTWTKLDDTYKTSTSTATGRATWYIPTEAIMEYDEYFCIFAQIDLTDSQNLATLDKVISAFADSAKCNSYEVYYTGTDYDETKENHGLTFHCEKDFNEDEVENLFEPEGEQYVCYERYTIKVPAVTGTENVAVKIKSAKIVQK